MPPADERLAIASWRRSLVTTQTDFRDFQREDREALAQLNEWSCPAHRDDSKFQLTKDMLRLGTKYRHPPTDNEHPARFRLGRGPGRMGEIRYMGDGILRYLTLEYRMRTLLHRAPRGVDWPRKRCDFDQPARWTAQLFDWAMPKSVGFGPTVLLLLPDGGFYDSLRDDHFTTDLLHLADASIHGIDVLLSAAEQAAPALAVSPANSKPSRRRGRKRQYDPKEDADLADCWNSGTYTRYAQVDGAKDKPSGYTKGAVDRHRHRKGPQEHRNK